MGTLVPFVGLSALHDPLFDAESSLALFGAMGAGLGARLNLCRILTSFVPAT
jgi:hypothetical protein